MAFNVTAARVAFKLDQLAWAVSKVFNAPKPKLKPLSEAPQQRQTPLEVLQLRLLLTTFVACHSLLHLTASDNCNSNNNNDDIHHLAAKNSIT